MARRPLAVPVVVLAVALLGCSPTTVSVAFTPEVGATYAYRYEIEATVRRAVEGQEPEVVHVDTELVAEQEVQERTADGARIRLVLTREGGVARTAVVLVDRAGSLEGVELVEDLDAAVFGIASSDTLVPTHLGGPPDRPLAPGDRWSVRDGERRGSGRLERLGVVDGADVAVVRVTVTEDLARSLRTGASAHTRSRARCAPGRRRPTTSRTVRSAAPARGRADPSTPSSRRQPGSWPSRSTPRSTTRCPCGSPGRTDHPVVSAASAASGGSWPPRSGPSTTTTCAPEIVPGTVVVIGATVDAGAPMAEATAWASSS